jgi:hypothetical protein
LELDHIFIRATAGAPEAEVLRAFGLIEGSGNRHSGQGTANRRFFFHNAFLELLWIDDLAEVRSDATRRTRLAEHLDDRAGAASPFGLCFRPSPGAPAVPFPSWDYRPAYLPAGMKIDIALNAPSSEPMWFFLERGSTPMAAPEERRQPLKHASAVREITSVTITLAGANALPRSNAALAAQATGAVALSDGAAHLVEICFDHGAAGGYHDFRPALPLVFRY